jgi:PAS domain S-box-containing protein
VERTIAWRTTVVRDEAGKAIGVLSSGEDVTEQRRAERELVKREALLRAAQEIANLGNYEVRTPGEAPAWSEQLYRITGRERAAGALAPAALIEELVHPNDRERVRHEWRRVITDGGEFDQVFRIVRADGTTREVHGHAQVRARPAHNEPWITGTLHDVTERRRAEDELRQEHERLQHVARLSTMGEMATGLAHEINQPLTAIATYAQAGRRLLASPAGAEREDLEEALTQITNQALRAGEVIRRLREFVRNRTTSTESIDLNRLIEDLRVLAEPDARLNDMRLGLELAPALPLVAADPVQIQQVLLNLVRNAIDATLETPGAPREIVVRTGVEDGSVRVEVVDRAGGIDPTVAANLFNPFFTTKKAGTGLGLAISRSIIRAHRGKLSHQPTPGGGTTFVFTIPVLPGA